ncbi:MAG TPA: L,D-transpeptidase family protein [Phycisphaerales bacterium]|nr:L,D-transpeptidase family protein [Phycisphaerales bacterium]
MTLPSQMPRVSRVAATKPFRSRGGSIKMLAVWGLVVGGVAAGAWAIFWRDGGGYEGNRKDETAVVEPASAKISAPTTPDGSGVKTADGTSAATEKLGAGVTASPPVANQGMPPTITMGEKPGKAPVTPPSSLAGGTTTTTGVGENGALRTVYGSPDGTGVAKGTDTTPAPKQETAKSVPVEANPGLKPQTKTPGGTSGAIPGGNPAGGAPGTQTPAMMTSSPVVERLVTAGESELAAGKVVEARSTFNRALHSPEAGAADKEMLRGKLSQLSERMTFSTAVTPGDAMCESYSIQAGDTLVRIARNKDLGVDWRFIQRVNGMSDPGKLRLNQSVKLVHGPFHAVVDKSEYRLDLYSDMKDAEGNRLFIRSFKVGLGEGGSTPLGGFVVKSGSKLVNPHWVNPRTGEKFDANDPKNPIGERWVGLEGTEAGTKSMTGYGIHGTIDPDSIGQQKSMGCIRMAETDVEIVYEMLAEGKSTVLIVP